MCEKLLALGYNVIGADIKHNEWNEKIDKLTHIVDLTDKRAVNKLPNDFDIIIHLAANARVYDLVVNPELARDNFEMIFNMLEFSRKNEIKSFVFSSSREVYGNSGKLIHSEENADIKHTESPYSATKLGGEALVRSYNQCYNTDFIIFRFSNVYGMYDNSNRVIPLFINLCRQGKDLTVFGKEKMLDFTYIDDTISGIISGIENFDTVKNNVFNLGYGQGTSILKVAELIKQELKSNVNIHLKENRTGEVVKYIADISNAKAKLGYDPKVKIGEGIKKSIEWYSKSLLLPAIHA